MKGIRGSSVLYCGCSAALLRYRRVSAATEGERAAPITLVDQHLNDSRRAACGQHPLDDVLLHQPHGLRLRGATFHPAKGIDADYVLVLDLAVREFRFSARMEDEPVMLHPHFAYRRPRSGGSSTSRCPEPGAAPESLLTDAARWSLSAS